MNISPMTPRFLRETILNICIIIGAIVAIVGVVCLIFTDLSKIDAAIVTVLGAAIFFGFRKVKSINADHDMSDAEEDSDGAP